MLSQSAKTYLAFCICVLISHAFGNSDINAIDNPIDEDLNNLDNDIGIISKNNDKLDTKSSDMPASIVLLLLCIFVSLGLVCIRHIKREWTQQQQYLLAKQAGAILGGGSSNVATKSYGSTSSPRLNADTIDEYIEDSLYGNNPLIDRLNQYRQALQQRFVEYMEKTPEPVLFEANPDKSIEAYNKNPEIPDNPNYEAKPFQHSENYQATPPPALQRMFQRNYDKNLKRRGLSAEPIKIKSSPSNNDNSESDGGYDEIKEDVQQTINSLTKKRRKIGGFPIVKARSEITPPPQHLDNMDNRSLRSRISLRNQINNDDFDDYNNNYYGGGNGDYNTIPDNNNNYNAYSDSDKNLSDGDNGAYQNIDDNKTETTMVIKVLDLD